MTARSTFEEARFQCHVSQQYGALECTDAAGARVVPHAWHGPTHVCFGHTAATAPRCNKPQIWTRRPALTGVAPMGVCSCFEQYGALHCTDGAGAHLGPKVQCMGHGPQPTLLEPQRLSHSHCCDCSLPQRAILRLSGPACRVQGRRRGRLRL